MLTQTRTAISAVMLGLVLLIEGTTDANAASKLPDPINAGTAARLYRLDCGHSLANDESVWTPGESVVLRYRTPTETTSVTSGCSPMPQF